MNDIARLSALLQEKNLLVATKGTDIPTTIERLANDSREVGPNDVFIAIRGEAVDGHLFIEKAVKNGAIAVVCEVMPEEALTRFPGTAFIKVSNARAALAELAAYHTGYPARSLEMIGITGTNGKTTTAFLIHHMLSSIGRTSGLLSTVEYRIGSATLEATHTTPDALATNQLLRRMVGASCDACVMEVSSHALIQDRVRAIEYRVGIFTNLSQDHLDYHGSMDEYLRAKKVLFDHLEPKAHAVYNADDKAGLRMISDTSAQTVSYGLHPGATIHGHIVQNTINGLVLDIESITSSFQLVGHFNAYNLLGAYAAGKVLGYDRDTLLRALTSAPPVPGRFEIIRGSNNRVVIVDYAHTPDALKNVLHTIRQTMPEGSALWSVFGCGGDRDQGKRPLMGQIAEQLSDHLVVTSDNPRNEDPVQILEDIKTGISEPQRALWIPSRRKAIQEAAARSSAGDVILIAGKGHEAYQIIQSEIISFDDREEARIAFEANTD